VDGEALAGNKKGNYIVDFTCSGAGQFLSVSAGWSIDLALKMSVWEAFSA
jgi:hypothetical protein